MARETKALPARNTNATVSGGVQTNGLSIAGRISVVALNDTTWTALPATPLSDRNAMAMQNTSGIQVKYNYDNTTVGYVGWIVNDGGEAFWDITEGIMVYAKSQSGTPNVIVQEIS